MLGRKYSQHPSSQQWYTGLDDGPLRKTIHKNYPPPILRMLRWTRGKANKDHIKNEDIEPMTTFLNILLCHRNDRRVLRNMLPPHWHILNLTYLFIEEEEEEEDEECSLFDPKYKHININTINKHVLLNSTTCKWKTENYIIKKWQHGYFTVLKKWDQETPLRLLKWLSRSHL